MVLIPLTATVSAAGATVIAYGVTAPAAVALTLVNFGPELATIWLKAVGKHGQKSGGHDECEH